MNRISVVTICYNEEKNIESTIASVLSQTYKNIEYIIKDGDSSDSTNLIIESMVSRHIDTGIEVRHIVAKDRGIYDAMNQALDMCTGDWVIFINSGDSFYGVDTLERIFGDNRKYEEDIVYGDVVTRDFSGSSIWSGNMEKLPFAMPFSHQACLVKRSVIADARFDTKYRIAADYKMILSFYKNGCSFTNANEIIAVYNLEGVSSTNYVKKVQEQYGVIRELGYINFACGLKYPLRILEAVIKGILDKYLPKDVQAKLRNVYKYKVKGYKKMR